MFNLTLKQCRYLAAVVEYGGLAQAARHINISQPAIAQAIDKLEQECRFKVFNRHHAKGLELTPKGRAVFNEIRDLLAQAEQTEMAIKAIEQGVKGTIRLGCFASLSPFFLGKIVKHYREYHPEIKIEIFELLHEEMIQALKDDKIDLAILYDMGLQNHLLKFVKLKSLPPYVILPRDHVLATMDHVDLHTLANEPYILFDAAGSKEYYYQLFANLNIEPKIAFRSTSMEMVKSAVANGLGYSILAMRPPHNQSYDGSEIIKLDISNAIDPLDIVIAQNKHANDNHIFAQFIDFCLMEFGE